MSGHIFFSDRFFGYDDARLRGGAPARDPGADRAILDRSCSPTCRPRTTTPELRVDCPDAVRFRVVERVRERLASYPVNDAGWGSGAVRRRLGSSCARPTPSRRWCSVSRPASAAKRDEYRGIVRRIVEEERARLGRLKRARMGGRSARRMGGGSVPDSAGLAALGSARRSRVDVKRRAAGTSASDPPSTNSTGRGHSGRRDRGGETTAAATSAAGDDRPSGTGSALIAGACSADARSLSSIGSRSCPVRPRSDARRGSPTPRPDPSPHGRARVSRSSTRWCRRGRASRRRRPLVAGAARVRKGGTRMSSKIAPIEEIATAAASRPRARSSRRPSTSPIAPK